MNRRLDVPWFNPREMDDATVRQLNTGREALLRQLSNTIQSRLDQPGAFQHCLITGRRGAGKSFFLRLLQTCFKDYFEPSQARFILLPEENPNIYAPHQFLAEIERLLKGENGASPAWRIDNPDSAWQKQLHSLLNAFPQALLVIGVENFDFLLQQAFSTDIEASRLRHLMSHEPRLMFVVTALQGDLDENYDHRLFRQFEQYQLPLWSSNDHRVYLQRRAQHAGKTVNSMQLARVEAYSHYTGGNARAAAVLAGAILEDHNPLQAADDLDSAIEKMSDYYRNLLERIPANTRKLFDALIRGGEPASQTEIAERVAAKQNEITRAFSWLVDNAYISETRAPGEKSKQYRVCDRLLVQFYHMRYINPGQRSKLAIMTDLLADVLLFPQKWQFAQQYQDQGLSHEASTLIELAFKERGILPNRLPTHLRDNVQACSLGNEWQQWDKLVGLPIPEVVAKLFELYPSDDCFKQALERVYQLSKACCPSHTSIAELADYFYTNPFSNPTDRFVGLMALISPQAIDIQANDWIPLIKSEAAEWLADTSRSDEEKNHLLAQKHKLEQDLPRTFSLFCAAKYVLDTSLEWQSIPLITAAEWAAEAALNFAQKAYEDDAWNSHYFCMLLLEKYSLLATDFTWEPVNTLLQKLADPALSASLPLTWIIKANAHIASGQHQQAHQLYVQAQAQLQNNNQTHFQTVLIHCQAQEAFCLSELGQFSEALVLHQQVQASLFGQEISISAAWSVGQLARCQIHVAGISQAWQSIDEKSVLLAPHLDVVIAQLGDAVADLCKQQMQTSAFGLGLDILQGLAQHTQFPLEKCLRTLWINMIDVAVPFVLLRELLAEWSGVFGANKALASLNALLLEWINDLEMPIERRTKHRLKLQPDLATTLSALSTVLQGATKRRLGL